MHRALSTYIPDLEPFTSSNHLSCGARKECDQLGVLVETVVIVDCEVAAKERQGDVTKFVRYPGTGVEGRRGVLENHPDYLWRKNAPTQSRTRVANASVGG